MKYSLALSIKDPPNTTGELDTRRSFALEKVEADDLLQLVSQFNMMVLTIQRQEHEQKVRDIKSKFDDDIPF